MQGRPCPGQSAKGQGTHPPRDPGPVSRPVYTGRGRGRGCQRPLEHRPRVCDCTHRPHLHPRGTPGRAPRLPGRSPKHVVLSPRVLLRERDIQPPPRERVCVPRLGPDRGSDEGVGLGGVAPRGRVTPSSEAAAVAGSRQTLQRSRASSSSLTPFAHSLAPLMSASWVLAGPGPVWAGTTAPPPGRGALRAGAWVRPLQGTLFQITRFSSLISTPPPTTLSPQREKLGQRREASCGLRAGRGAWGLGGVSGSCWGALLALPEGTEPPVLPLDLLFLPSPRGQPSWWPHSLTCPRGPEKTPGAGSGSRTPPPSRCWEGLFPERLVGTGVAVRAGLVTPCLPDRLLGTETALEAPSPRKTLRPRGWLAPLGCAAARTPGEAGSRLDPHPLGWGGVFTGCERGAAVLSHGPCLPGGKPSCSVSLAVPLIAGVTPPSACVTPCHSRCHPHCVPCHPYHAPCHLPSCPVSPPLLVPVSPPTMPRVSPHRAPCRAPPRRAPSLRAGRWVRLLSFPGPQVSTRVFVVTCELTPVNFQKDFESTM